MLDAMGSAPGRPPLYPWCLCCMTCRPGEVSHSVPSQPISLKSHCTAALFPSPTVSEPCEPRRPVSHRSLCSCALSARGVTEPPPCVTHPPRRIKRAQGHASSCYKRSDPSRRTSSVARDTSFSRGRRWSPGLETAPRACGAQRSAPINLWIVGGTARAQGWLSFGATRPALGRGPFQASDLQWGRMESDGEE